MRYLIMTSWQVVVMTCEWRKWIICVCIFLLGLCRTKAHLAALPQNKHTTETYFDASLSYMIEWWYHDMYRKISRCRTSTDLVQAFQNFRVQSDQKSYTSGVTPSNQSDTQIEPRILSEISPKFCRCRRPPTSRRGPPRRHEPGGNDR